MGGDAFGSVRFAHSTRSKGHARMSESQYRKAEKWLRKHRPDMTCPFCQRVNPFWIKLQSGLLLAECDHCGLRQSFNAAKAGIFPSPSAD
jgi:transcription elongation factor Elf1